MTSILSLGRRLSSYLQDPKGLITIALISAIVASFSEGFGVGMMVPLWQGEVKEAGSWSELIQREGLFWQLYNLQCVSV
jgi:hypothetical protein